MPNFFQEQMEKLFSGFENVVIYLDDLFLFSGSYAKHTAHLIKVIKQLTHVNLRISFKKWQFAHKE
ncbi:hypothetical protein HDU79_001993, partial [Rhizoclosmatium sp. JEL0117]